MFFERHKGGERAALVHILQQDASENLPEFQALADSAGVFVVESVVVPNLSTINPSFFIGSGKVQELADLFKSLEIDVVLFDHSLSPAQGRNLERAWCCRVIDRTELILDIFAQRARTHEGKLQVELAQLQYLRTRLIRGWTHLERQKGGIGLRGPGETQLETDRRLVGQRVRSIQNRLQKVKRQRAQGRRARTKAKLPQLALVGYTNAGKSTLFNRITTSNIYANDQLFATLDPTIRRLQIDSIGTVALADTVGFIRNLPHTLVEAFSATLEEVTESQLLLHVIDSSNNERDSQIEQVEKVLEQIDAQKILRLEVFNKIDQIEGFKPRLDRDDQGRPWRVWISAGKDLGLNLLREAISELIGDKIVTHELILPIGSNRLRAHFYELGAILQESYDDQGDCHLSVRLSDADFLRALQKEGVDSKDKSIVRR